MDGSKGVGVRVGLMIYVVYGINWATMTEFHMTTYNVSSMCGSHINMKWRNIYTAELLFSPIKHSSPPNLREGPSSGAPYNVYKSCDITVESWDFLNKLMVRFEEFSTNHSCSDVSLELLDGLTEVNSIQGLPRPICGNDRSVVTSRTFVTSYKYLTLRIYGNSLHKKDFTIRLFITAFQDGKSCFSYEHPCGNGRCIMEELTCNGYNPCGDHSDCPPSPTPELHQIEDQPVPVLFIAIVSLSVSFVAIIVGAAVLLRYLRRKRLGQEYQSAPVVVESQPGTAEDIPAGYQRTESQIETDRQFAPPSYNSLPICSEHLQEGTPPMVTANDDKDADECPDPDVTCFNPDNPCPPAYNCVMQHQDIFQVSQIDVHVDAETDDKV